MRTRPVFLLLTLKPIPFEQLHDLSQHVDNVLASTTPVFCDHENIVDEYVGSCEGLLFMA